MVKKCAICDIEEGNFVHALNGKEVIVACDKCAKDEGLIIVRQPTEEQIAYANKPYTVRERLAKAMGPAPKKAEGKLVAPGAPRLYCISPLHKVDLPIKLVDNFNWEILRARKSKKLTQHQVSEAIHEPIESIKVIESGCLSENSEKLISKLEQYFHIRLRADSNIIPIPSSNKAVMSKDSVKSLTVGDLLKVQKEREKIKKEGDEEDEDSGDVVGDEVELEE